MKRVLKLSAYRRLLTAYTLNELAYSIGSLALAVLVYRKTGSAVGATAYFFCAQFVPALVSPSVVARIDERPARQVLPLLYGFEAIVFLALGWVASRFALAPVLALALLDGVAAVSARAITRATTVSVTAPAGLLREGNALTNVSFSISWMAGPALAGVVVLAGGTTATLLGNGGLFALVALTIATADGLPKEVPEPERPASGGRVRAALSHARQHAAIRRLLTIQAAALLFFTMSIPVEVVFAQHSLHAGAEGYGALLSAWGAGAVAGSAVYARWRGLSARTLLSVGAAALGVGFVGMAVAPSLAIAIVGAAIAGGGNGIEAVAQRSALQEEVEQRWMTLIMSFNESLFQAVPGFGILIGGALAAIFSPRLALAVAGAGTLVITAVVWLVLAPGTAVPGASTGEHV